MESVFYGIKTLKLDIMIKYSEIKKVAKEKFGNGKYLTDKEDGFRQGAEWVLEQVKNCSIPAVVGRSEQLMAFAEYCNDEHGLFIPSWMIDGYNKSR